MPLVCWRKHASCSGLPTLLHNSYCTLLKIENFALGLNTFFSGNICTILSLKISLESPKNRYFYLQMSHFFENDVFKSKITHKLTKKFRDYSQFIAVKA
jgi:hypothetical protein